MWVKLRSLPGRRLFPKHASDVRLSEFGFRIRERFLYEYDFGDRWQHDIRLEREIAVDPRITYPVCIGGRRTCPPEDCGGPWGYVQWEDGASIADVEEHLCYRSEYAGTDFSARSAV